MCLYVFRCVNLLEIIYSKSTLFNVITSSLIICATGFNLMVRLLRIYSLKLMSVLVCFDL